MQVSPLFEDINAGCLTEVIEAANHYYDNVRGLTVRQQFFIYPNGTIACLNAVDCNYSALILHGDDEAVFRHIHSRYFN